MNYKEYFWKEKLIEGVATLRLRLLIYILGCWHPLVLFTDQVKTNPALCICKCDGVGNPLLQKLSVTTHI